ncbi:MAG TPA: DUF6345 domain-containing protein [Dissulfurispiraceae bacterium]|nr:DUF6345 domain-containing protein [Dissulfurispiraceae bacterium]
MRFTRMKLSEPFAESSEAKLKGIKAVIAGSNDFYGANSLEHFSSASGLTYTHEDAQGFLDYPTSFPGKAANFWLKDAGVKVWEYEETYDNWQDTYGMDSVMVFYHSGHGNMDSNGVFQAPLGAKWDNRDWAYSNNMAFANEELRYLFWSTCFSLRVSGPDNPVRTWWGPNKGGLRMLFGYETTSMDDPNYGKYFWDEWNKGKNFAQAFLDSSWRISHSQVPVAMAVGSNQADAISRLNTERYFTKNPVNKGWYQWQWIGTLPNRSFSYRSDAPKGLNAVILDNRLFTDERISKIAQDIEFTKKSSETIELDETGNRTLFYKKMQISLNSNGALNLHFGRIPSNNPNLLDEGKAIKIAQKLIRELSFDKDVELKLGNIRHVFTAGGTQQGSGRIEDPSAIETIVQFRQCHKGVESVNSDHGLIAICIDNDGEIINVYNSTKLILGESSTPRSIIPSPPDGQQDSADDPDKQFMKAINGLLNRSGNSHERAHGKAEVLREKVGYDFSLTIGPVVRQRDIDLTMFNNLRKRYKIRLRIMG